MYLAPIIWLYVIWKFSALLQIQQARRHASFVEARDIEWLTNFVQTATRKTSGTRLEYIGPGDEEGMRADTFTLDGGHLVKIDMVYISPSTNVEGYYPKSFGELFAGLQEAYGEPSKSYSESLVLPPYGIKYDARRAEWMGNQDVISIIEQPGHDVRTEIIAQTLTEYNRAAHAPKTANPLQ